MSGSDEIMPIKFPIVSGTLATIPANRIMEIPFPIPFSLIRSPSQIITDAPATKHAIMVIA